MATRNIVPRADGEGSIGTAAKAWGAAYLSDGVYTLGRGKAYSAGDVATVSGMKSYLRAECVTAGTTAATAPAAWASATAGSYVSDGTAKFIIDDIRNGHCVGEVFFDSILRPGCIRANGAKYANASANYPRLLAYLQANPSLLAANAAAYAANHGLWLYDSGTDTLTAPNYIDKVMEGAASVTELAAGLPNIKGHVFEIAYSSVAQPTSDGALYPEVFHTAAISSGTTNWEGYVRLDASRYNAIYSDSVTTVQMAAITGIPQCKY